MCGHCGATNAIVPRRTDADIARINSTPRTSGAIRIERLRQQANMLAKIPPTLSHLTIWSKIHPTKLEEATALLDATYVKVNRPSKLKGQRAELEETIFFLTMLLAAHCDDSPAGQLEERSLYEASLDVLTEGSYRDYLFGFLCRSAARQQDFLSAHAWLDLIDPQGDDIRSHSAYRLSAAYLATCEGDFETVIDALGRERDHVPIINELEVLASVLRIDAFENQGEQETAYRLMRALCDSPQMVSHVDQMTRPTSNMPRLCQKTRSILPEPQVEAHVARSDGRVCVPSKVRGFLETGEHSGGEKQFRVELEVWPDQSPPYMASVLDYFGPHDSAALSAEGIEVSVWVNPQSPDDISFV